MRMAIRFCKSVLGAQNADVFLPQSFRFFHIAVVSLWTWWRVGCFVAWSTNGLCPFSSCAFPVPRLTATNEQGHRANYYYSHGCSPVEKSGHRLVDSLGGCKFSPVFQNGCLSHGPFWAMKGSPLSRLWPLPIPCLTPCVGPWQHQGERSRL